MSSLALMRWLEGAPERYDAGMRALTFGRVRPLHARVAEWAVPRPGARVLEVGCGTGAVTERLVAGGARVTALDQNPAMLEIAQRRLAAAPAGVVEWLERTASGERDVRSQISAIGRFSRWRISKISTCQSPKSSS